LSGEILKRGIQLGRYEVRELLGRGGMGQVYRAWDPALSRDVAIKVLGDPEPQLLKRFSREAEAVSRLNHPNVVSILDFSMGPPPHIVMTHLRGQDLATRLKRGPMEIGEAVDIMLGVCAGVHACHVQGIIHRDLKPGNVFLQQTPEGTEVKVLDFGVAILGENVSGDITRPGHVVGTPRYLSPEQIKHMEVDAKSDQYAAGLLLYTALMGKSPFRSLEGTELVRAIVKAKYPRLRDVRPDVAARLEAAIGTAMNVDKERRFPAVLAFGRALLEFATSEGRAVWTDQFASAPVVLTAPLASAPGNIVEAAMANMTTRHETTTVEDWSSPVTDSTGDKSPRSAMAGLVVVPIAPFASAPVVATTARLQSETAIDISQAERDQVQVPPTVDLHLWSQPKREPSPQPQRAEVDSQAPMAQALTLWQRRPVLVATIVAVALVGGCLAWLIARLAGR
jgi:serine/threonine protein kinase